MANTASRRIFSKTGITAVFAALFYLNCAPRITAQCQECWCYPAVNPSTLFCQGLNVFDFPDLSPIISKQLLNIYIFTTNIACLPTLIDKERYSSLETFAEIDNLHWNCSCLDSWQGLLGNQVNFTTSCTHVSASTTLSVETSVKLTSAYLSYSSFKTPAETTPYSTQKSSTLTSAEVLTTDQNFTPSIMFTSTPPLTDDGKLGSGRIIAYITAATAAVAGALAATVVAALYIPWRNLPDLCVRRCPHHQEIAPKSDSALRRIGLRC